MGLWQCPQDKKRVSDVELENLKIKKDYTQQLKSGTTQMRVK